VTKYVATKVAKDVAKVVAKAPVVPVMWRERAPDRRSASPPLNQAKDKTWQTANKRKSMDSWLDDSEECAAGPSPQGERSHTSRAPYLVTAFPWDGGDRIPIPVRYCGS
jgi:hypothetical protein